MPNHNTQPPPTCADTTHTGLLAEIRRRLHDADAAREHQRAQRARRGYLATARRAADGPRRDRLGAHRPASGRLAHRMRLPAHTATSGVLKSFYPWVMDPGLGVPGIYIGMDLYSRASFLWDPWELYAAGIITSPNGILVGEIGSAKSSLLKSMIMRFAAVGIPFSWVDVKDEYTPLAQVLGVEPLRLGPGLGVRLNPLAAHGRYPGQTDDAWRADLTARRLNLLEGLVHVRLDRPLSMTERTALELALASCTGQLPGVARGTLAPASLPAVVGKLQATEEWTSALRDRGVTATQLLDDSRDARLALHSLVDGPLRGMFDATDDAHRYLDFDAPGTVLNLHAVRADQAVTVMSMVCAQSAMEAALMRPNARPRLVGYDESWLAMRYVPLLRRLQEAAKLARMFGITNILAAHRLTDYAAGAEGSEAARLARGLIEDTGFRVVYRQTDASLPITRDMLGLTDVQTGLLKYLRKGTGMWLLGNRAFVVQHLLSSVEEPLVQTDSRMNLRRADRDEIADEDWDSLLELSASPREDT
ncbi:hypothetical protein [Amycolatopsis sp. GM8]|uniref:hypothetical protein n=1 Tax=Amycolatopsis sp. GM8 TaxID=2896530 RepID=UPI001F1A58B2|nr:hypothetical protein [Amycolatopsis sp. GM8]